MKWIQKIKQWLITKQFIFEEEITPVIKAQTSQENPRDAETRKRVAAAFKAQEAQMQVRAFKPHAADCKDPWTCDKRICFQWKPDIIVSIEEIPVDLKSERDRKIRYSDLKDREL